MMVPVHDERELAEAILAGAKRRPAQSFGHYFTGDHASCALGAAYEGMYLLPRDASTVVPRRLERLFDCLDTVIRRCPEACRKSLSLASMIVHLNDDHQWTREQIAAWLKGEG